VFGLAKSRFQTPFERQRQVQYCLDRQQLDGLVVLLDRFSRTPFGTRRSLRRLIMMRSMGWNVGAGAFLRTSRIMHDLDDRTGGLSVEKSYYCIEWFRLRRDLMMCQRCNADAFMTHRGQPFLKSALAFDASFKGRTREDFVCSFDVNML